MQSPCHPGCPNAEERPVIYDCGLCHNSIKERDEYMDLPYYGECHVECANRLTWKDIMDLYDISKSDLFDMMGEAVQLAEACV